MADSKLRVSAKDGSSSKKGKASTKSNASEFSSEGKSPQGSDAPVRVVSTRSWRQSIFGGAPSATGDESARPSETPGPSARGGISGRMSVLFGGSETPGPSARGGISGRMSVLFGKVSGRGSVQLQTEAEVTESAQAKAARRAAGEDSEEGSDDLDESDLDDGKELECSDDEELDGKQREVPEAVVEQVRLPDSIRERYTFLALVQDPGYGRRVFFCEDRLAEPEVTGPVEQKGGRGGQVGLGKDELAEEERRKKKEAEAKKLAADIGTGFNAGSPAHGEKSKAHAAKKVPLVPCVKRRRCVVKAWDKEARPEDVTKEWLEMQVRLLGMPRHPNVLLPRRILEDEHRYYVVFDALLEGCSLLTLILNEPSIMERQLKRIVRGLLLGLGHLHKHGLCHRDMKPENVLLEWREAEILLAKGTHAPQAWKSAKGGIRRWKKPASFKNSGCRHELAAYARIVDLDTVVDSAEAPGVLCGTPGYMAPEAFLRSAGPPGDLFAVGVILHLLVACEHPCYDVAFSIFAGDDVAEVPRQRCEKAARAVERAVGQIRWNGQPWDKLGMARDLCRLLLNARPEARGADAEDVLRTSPWLRSQGAEGTFDMSSLSHLRSRLPGDDDSGSEKGEGTKAKDPDMGGAAMMGGMMGGATQQGGRRGQICIPVPEAIVEKPVKVPRKTARTTTALGSRAGSMDSTQSSADPSGLADLSSADLDRLNLHGSASMQLGMSRAATMKSSSSAVQFMGRSP